jgi:tRNA uridine 5-carboxymethylaminomethyl modification enzyme
LGSSPLSTATSLASLLCRPELDYELLKPLDPGRPELPNDVIEQVQIEIRYEGYIKRQEKQVREQERLEVKLIPENIDYDDVPSLRLEARQHLKEFRPVSVGQASRISGVSPADISVLLVYLEKLNRKNISNN